ncbi:hypothetical protein BGX29_002879, partial [Mortierella sp. GBA35]
MDLSTLVASNDDSSAWPYFHIRVFDINCLTYRYSMKFLYEVKDCKDDRAAVATNAVNSRTSVTSSATTIASATHQATASTLIPAAASLLNGIPVTTVREGSMPSLIASVGEANVATVSTVSHAMQRNSRRAHQVILLREGHVNIP